MARRHPPSGTSLLELGIHGRFIGPCSSSIPPFDQMWIISSRVRIRRIKAHPRSSHSLCHLCQGLTASRPMFAICSPCSVMSIQLRRGCMSLRHNPRCCSYIRKAMLPSPLLNPEGAAFIQAVLNNVPSFMHAARYSEEYLSNIGQTACSLAWSSFSSRLFVFANV